jgi:hypothetical protein
MELIVAAASGLLQQQTGSRFGIEVMHRGENSGMERTGRLGWIPSRMPVR